MTNRKIKLNFITEKDKLAILIGKKLNINNYALSFTNSQEDVFNFNKLLKSEKKILKIETKNAIKLGNKKKKKIYVATNFLESMLFNKYPLKGEINDIYNTLELGASGLVLAAETAIGKYPKECVILLKKIIKVFKKYN